MVLKRDCLLVFSQKTEAALVLRNRTGAYSFGCIEEPKENERLNCSHISTFSSYLQAATNLDGLDEKLNKTLLSIRQHVEDLRRNRECSSNSTNTCESAFHSSKKASKNAEKLRNLLELFVLWINKLTKAWWNCWIVHYLQMPFTIYEFCFCRFGYL